LLNEEKTNDYEHFEKGMIYMKILKKGGVVEKGGGGNEIHAPCACGTDVQKGRGLILARTCRADGTGFDPRTDVPCRRDEV
jgi:hypothetical protein